MQVSPGAAFFDVSLEKLVIRQLFLPFLIPFLVSVSGKSAAWLLCTETIVEVATERPTEV